MALTEIKMSCTTCRNRLDLEKLDYHVGCVHTKMGGYICLALASEGLAAWMVNINGDDSCCEMWSYKEKDDGR